MRYYQVTLLLAGQTLLISLCRSMDQVTTRLDKLISQIQDLQRPYINGEKPCDVLLV